MCVGKACLNDEGPELQAGRSPAARETGRSDSEARTALEGGGVAARVDSTAPPSAHGSGVFRADLGDGRVWVARIFPPGTRSAELGAGEIEILRFLEENDYPAERWACPEPLTTFGEHAAGFLDAVANEIPPVSASRRRCSHAPRRDYSPQRRQDHDRCRHPRGDRERLQQPHPAGARRTVALFKDVIRIHQLYFAAWRYWRTVTSGTVPDGSEPWWPNREMTDAIAEEAAL